MRIVVAMSGGVDSAVTAGLLKEQGHEVIGVTLQLYDQGQMAAKKGACCAGQDIYDARTAADHLGIPHYVLDYERDFKRDVIDPFADAYVAGETPIPCVLCNQTVKFRDLLKVAKELGGDALATGHYVQRFEGPEGAELHRAVDPVRDQSYFLFTLTQEQLEFVRFPLGGYASKAETRAEAARLGLAISQKPDSQDICFVPDGDYAGLVAKLRPAMVKAGEIVHLDGRVLGQHEGLIHYTIGQRKGLGIGGRKGEPEEPLYVVKLDAPTARVIVGPREALAVQRVPLRDLNWLGAPLSATGLPIEVKLRSAQQPTPAEIALRADGVPEIILFAPQYGVSPGQAAVVYQGNRVLGGGWIMAQDAPQLKQPDTQKETVG